MLDKSLNSLPGQADIIAENTKLRSDLDAANSEIKSLTSANEALEKENSAMKVQVSSFEAAVASRVSMLGIKGKPIETTTKTSREAVVNFTEMAKAARAGSGGK